MVDKARFELATSALRRQRSTGLIYLPMRIIRYPPDLHLGFKDSYCSDVVSAIHATTVSGSRWKTPWNLLPSVMDLSSNHHHNGMTPNQGRSKGPRPLEVWSADVPFDGRCGSKDRPVVVLGRRGPSYDIMMVTTHPHDGSYMRPLDPYDAGLDSRSHIRTDKVFRLSESHFNYFIGDLSEDDAAVLEAKYKRMVKGRWTGSRPQRRSSPPRPTGSAWTCAS